MYLHHRVNLNDKVVMNIDERDYQSIGVNYSKGHGVHVQGFVEPFDSYKMDTLSVCKKFWFPTALKLSKMFAGRFAFFRNPAYPYLISVTYKIFGVHPALIKNIQFFSLILIISLLPILAYLLWGKKGFLAGFITGLFLVNYDFYYMSSTLMTEWIQAITILFVVFGEFYFQKNEIISVP